ncbi:RNA-binding cell elongation regulator Jag/EloR [Paenibacillus dakarensis]|uniref:RNA-binding cell elongation regulator Jag/EloR n=1 Tax=Paenibacillus dakarensis TaxID=1527293 RepID=UPI0006D585B8|nr:RNA-binding cell elongation regulator Jag/EloR [Paenibacillus dakarensis]
MSTIVATGKTVEDAVEQGLAHWGVSRDQVSVQILSQPSKGFLGLFGVKEAKVQLTLNSVSTGGEKLNQDFASVKQAAPTLEVQKASATLVSEKDETASLSVDKNEDAVKRKEVDPYREAVSFLIETGKAMGLNVSVDVEHGKEFTTLHVSGSGLGLMIGRRGQTLDALQYLVNIVANRYSDHYVRIILDAENFRERRKKTLEELADRLAARAVKTRKEVVLEPMPAAERKIIHFRLQNHAQVKTYSKGEEPNRRIVITLKQQ